MAVNAEKEKKDRDLYLFILHLWRDEQTSIPSVWRGKIQNLQSKEVQYFRGWPDMARKLEELMSELS